MLNNKHEYLKSCQKKGHKKAVVSKLRQSSKVIEDRQGKARRGNLRTLMHVPYRTYVRDVHPLQTCHIK